MTTRAPKERPILFSAEMVRAILDGRKTQTRRPVKPPKSRHGIDAARVVPTLMPGVTGWDVQYDLDTPRYIRCPYGKPGDRLWVREAWRPVRSQEGSGGYAGTVCDMVEYRAHEGHKRHCKITRACSGLSYVGSPDGYGCIFLKAGWWTMRGGEEGPWRPSIYMPRWASRITLEVTGVRVERVQDIHRSDCLREGLRPPRCTGMNVGAAGWDPRDAFHDLWDNINAKRGFGWDANPWVWVVEFRRLDESNAPVGGVGRDRGE